MADYGVCLKAGMDESKALFRMKVSMLRLFLSTGQGQYARCLICDLLIQSHQFRNGHAVWKLTRADPNCFNEEAGEISLSVLSRLTAGADRRNIDLMQRRYRLTKSSLVVAHHMKSASRWRSMIPRRTKKYVIDVDGAEVSTTLHYFQDVIRKCKVNQHQIAQLPAKTTVVKRSADYNAALVRASHLPTRLWWDASHDAKLEDAFDYHVKHIDQKWLSAEYCQWSKPWLYQGTNVPF